MLFRSWGRGLWRAVIPCMAGSLLIAIFVNVGPENFGERAANGDGNSEGVLHSAGVLAEDSLHATLLEDIDDGEEDL